MGCFQSAAYHPFLRRQVAYFIEVTFERGKAPPGIIGHFRQRKVVHVVLFHEVHDVDFPRVGEVEKRGIQVLVRIQEYVQSLGRMPELKYGVIDSNRLTMSGRSDGSLYRLTLLRRAFSGRLSLSKRQ